VVSLSLANPQVITAGDFKKVLKQNGFIDKDSKVTRRKSFTDWTDFEYEVFTRRCMNIGNLIEIEKRYGLTLNFVAPDLNGQMRAMTKYGEMKEH